MTTPTSIEARDLFDGMPGRVAERDHLAIRGLPAARTATPDSPLVEVDELLDGTLYVARRRRRPRTGPRLRAATLSIGPPLLAAIAVAVAWEAWVHWRDVPEYLVPAPSAVAAALAADPSRFLEAGWASLTEALGGLVIGAGAAFLLAVVMAHSRLLERALYPLALLVKVTPIIAVAPLFIIWFGYSAWPKVIVVALLTFFPMLVNTVTGLRSVDPAAHDFLRALHASRWQVFWHLRLPASLPYLFAALRISVPLSLIGAVVAEWMAGDGGIGQVILIANGDFDTPALFAAVVVLAAIAVLLSVALALLERRMLFWHESSTDL